MRREKEREGRRRDGARRARALSDSLHAHTRSSLILLLSLDLQIACRILRGSRPRTDNVPRAQRVLVRPSNVEGAAQIWPPRCGGRRTRGVTRRVPVDSLSFSLPARERDVPTRERPFVIANRTPKNKYRAILPDPAECVSRLYRSRCYLTSLLPRGYIRVSSRFGKQERKKMERFAGRHVRRSALEIVLGVLVSCLR